MKKTMTTALRTTLMNIRNTESGYVVLPSDVTATAKSESGVTRVLDKYGKNTITVSVDIPAFASKFKNAFADPSKAAETLSNQYRDILLNGFTYNNIRYFWFMFSPSNARTADSVFVSANDWNEVEKLLSEVTTLHYGAGASDPFSPERAFGKNKDGVYQVLFSKVMARESARAAGSVRLKDLNEEDAAILSTFKTKYVDDLEGVNSTPWRNPITGEAGDTRATTPSDGMILVGEKARAVIGHAEGLISSEDRDYVLENPTSEKSEKILARCPAFIQPRIEGSLKGAVHAAHVHKFTDGEYEFVVFDSARKYKDDEWDWGTMEICNVSHRGSGYVQLNAPVINTLIRANVDILEPIARFWMTKVEAVFSNDLIEASKAVRYVMNALSANETDDEADNRTVITKALEANILLDRDHYVWTKVYDKMRAFATRMASGKLPAPGAYPYISVDTNWLLKALIEREDLVSNGVEIPTLQSGEYFYNGQKCRALIARSPLTHPNQVKVVNLVENHEYSSFKHVFIMNAFDGIWIDLSGADMDGDEVLLMTESQKADFPNDAVSAIIDTVANEPVLNYEPGLEGEYMEYSFENRVEFLVKNANRSKVGMLNNSYSAWVELYTHLRNLYLVMKNSGCVAIDFNDQYASTSIYAIKDNMVHTKAIRGAIPAGEYDERMVRAKMRVIWANIAELEILQSREVDAAKTNKGVTDEEAARVALNALPWGMIARQYSKGKLGDNTSRVKKVVEAAQQKAMKLASGEDEKTFGYHAMTPLGYLTDLVSAWWSEMKAKADTHSVSHSGYLYGLLSDTERTWFHNAYDTVRSYKELYGKRVSEIMKDDKADDLAKRVARKALKERVINALYALTANGCPIEVIAVAAYEACYLKNGGFNSGLSFGWLLSDELLKVFERGDQKYTYALLTVQGAKGFVKNGDVYVGNGIDRFHLDLGHTQFKDQSFETYYSMNGKLAAFIQKKVEYAVDATKSTAPRMASSVMGLTALTGSADEFMSKVKANNFFFVITVSEEGKTVAKVGDEIVADVVLVNPIHLSLLNKTVQWVRNDDAPFEKGNTWVKNITVVEQ